MFILVEFTDQKELAVVPDIWLEGTSCAVWPNFTSESKLQRAVRSKQRPEDDWKAFPIRELYKHESFDKVRSKLKAAEEDSDLQTVAEESDDEACRRSKRKRRARVEYSDDEEDLEYQIPQEKRHKSTSALLAELPTPPAMLQLHQNSSFQTNKLSTGRSPVPSLRSPQGPLVHSPLSPDLPRQPTSSISQTPSERAPALQQSPRSIFIPHRSVTDDRLPAPVFKSRPVPQQRPGSSEQSSQVRDMRLFTTLEKIKEEQVQQRGMLQTIMQMLQETPTSSESCRELPEAVSFPLKTVEDVQDLERDINDRTVFDSVVNYLSVLGGKNTSDTIRRILRHVLHNDLAKVYNWYGKKGKLKYGDLKLASVIHKAVRKTLKSVTETEVEIVTREWFRTASDRDGGRKQRDGGRMTCST